MYAVDCGYRAYDPSAVERHFRPDGYDKNISTVYMTSCMVLVLMVLVVADRIFSAASEPSCQVSGNVAQCASQNLTSVKQILVPGDRRNINLLLLQSNQIVLTNDSFEDFPSVSHMDLSYNNLSLLPEGVFKGLWKLVILSLNHNKLILLPENVFQNLGNLLQLHLYHNNLSSLPGCVFRGLQNLKLLDIASNKLTSLPESIFQTLGQLRHLFLSNNYQLSFLPEGVFRNLKSLKYLHMPTILSRDLDCENLCRLLELRGGNSSMCYGKLLEDYCSLGYCCASNGSSTSIHRVTGAGIGNSAKQYRVGKIHYLPGQPAGNRYKYCKMNGHRLDKKGILCNGTIVDCGNVLLRISNGTIATPTATTYASATNITCDTGYELVGPVTLTCQANKSWSSPGTCKAVDCGRAPNVKHGMITSPMTSYQSVSRVTCIAGYRLVGPTTVTCLANKSWSSSGTCIDIDECSSSENSCGSKVMCHNTPSSYTCNCTQGYTGTHCNGTRHQEIKTTKALAVTFVIYGSVVSVVVCFCIVGAVVFMKRRSSWMRWVSTSSFNSGFRNTRTDIFRRHDVEYDLPDHSF